MLKKALITVAILLSSSLVFAYNPPKMGENLYNFTSPSMLAGEASTAGGSLFYVSPEHMGINPAILASEQRVVINGAYTAMFDTSESVKYGQAFYAGTMVPTRFGVFSGALQGVFTTFDQMFLGNSFTIRGAFSKDLFDDLYVGFGLTTGFGTSWALYADIGILYLPNQISWLPFMSDIRLGISLTQMGKTFNMTSNGIKGNDDSIIGIPAMFTPRFGFAGTFLDVEHVKGGLSLDLAFPTFQNILFDTNIQFMFFDMVTLSTSWKFNLVETIYDKATYYPTISLSVKFDIDTNSKARSAYNTGRQNEIRVASAYKAIADDIHVISAGGGVHFGVIDEEPPEIILWED